MKKPLELNELVAFLMKHKPSQATKHVQIGLQLAIDEKNDVFIEKELIDTTAYLRRHFLLVAYDDFKNLSK